MPEEKESEEEERKSKEEKLKEMRERMQEMRESGGPGGPGGPGGMPGGMGQAMLRRMPGMQRGQQNKALLETMKRLQADMKDIKNYLQEIVETLKSRE